MIQRQCREYNSLNLGLMEGTLIETPGILSPNYIRQVQIKFIAWGLIGKQPSKEEETP
jgi:hypothetical protein